MPGIETRPLRVIIIEGLLLFRKALCQLLEQDDEISIAGDVASIERLATVGDLSEIDVVIFDFDNVSVDTSEVLEQFRQLVPGAHYCALSASARPEAMQHCLELGIEGYLTKDTSPSELLRAIKIIALGIPYADPSLAGDFFRRRSETRSNGTTGELSPRESEVVRLIAIGLSNRDISKRLKLSEKTVKNHISRIFTKLNINARTQAAVHAIRNGLV